MNKTSIVFVLFIVTSFLNLNAGTLYLGILNAYEEPVGDVRILSRVVSSGVDTFTPVDNVQSYDQLMRHPRNPNAFNYSFGSSGGSTWEFRLIKRGYDPYTFIHTFSASDQWKTVRLQEVNPELGPRDNYRPMDALKGLNFKIYTLHENESRIIPNGRLQQIIDDLNGYGANVNVVYHIDVREEFSAYDPDYGFALLLLSRENFHRYRHFRVNPRATVPKGVIRLGVIDK